MSNRKILLGISGSIAAVKAPQIVRLFIDRGFDVQCLLTRGADKFVAPLPLATFSGHPVYSDVFGDDAYQIPYLRFADEAAALVIAPASTNMIARMAHGLTEDVVSLVYAATKAPVFVAPAMHPPMWENAATQDNVKILKARKVTFLGPNIGPLADKSHGEGRMFEPEQIVDAVEKSLKK